MQPAQKLVKVPVVHSYDKVVDRVVLTQCQVTFAQIEFSRGATDPVYAEGSGRRPCQASARVRGQG